VKQEEDDLTRLTNSDDPTVLSTDHDATRLSGSFSSSWPASEGQRLEAGQAFGPYTIVKLLGHGGMGEVYEAVQVETGRRVAIKLLRGMMNQREDRARFLSEGRLAASISHPHTVYIFGSEEIDGMPVISMQLLPGGTLKDRVVERGPLPPAEAVSAILNVIGGLDAAASAGILHRDIKPSNCFVDVDGSVKVGDFGLSISTSAREARGINKGFQGTPQYAPPEQLRGEALDVRADIYAVGATLFYLLTGRAPFESRDFQELVEHVKNTPPPLAHKVRPGIPPALSALIVRCLAKDPSARPASYADLAKALRRFSGASRPASPSARVIAGIIDMIVVGVPVGILKSAVLQQGGARAAANVSVDPWPALISILYFALCEGIWATTVGKRLCGLRIVSTKGDVTLRQGFGRSIIFQAPQLPLVIGALMLGETSVADYLAAHPALAGLAAMGPTVVTALFFVTMRRRNGLAAVHDLLTGTRVVSKRVDEFRQASASVAGVDELAESAPAGARFGTFEVGALLGDVPGGKLFDGVDSVLKRRVWLIEWEPGTPETPKRRRDVDRVGRLHWLAGRRSAQENWDAFEAPPGGPIDPTPGGSSWKSVQGWLNDLAAELMASDRDGSMPPLSRDPLWIRHDGRAVLLDFPAPRHGIGTYFGQLSPDPKQSSPLQLLVAVANLSLGNKTSSQMPVSAVAMLDRWNKKQATLSIADAESDLGALATSSERVTRGRRMLPVLLGMAPIALMLIAAVFAMRMTSGKTGTGRLFTVLGLLGEANKETDPHYRQAYETYVAGTFRTELTDDALWKAFKDTDDKDKELPRLRETANRVAALHPTPAETAAAAYMIQPALDKLERKKNNTGGPTIFVVLVLVGCGMTFFCELVSVLARPSGIVLSAMGLAVVAASGREISRFRAVLRLLLAWLPMVIFTVLRVIPSSAPWMTQSMVPAGIALALMAVGVIWTAWRPTRGPHDIAARTTIGLR
jgi:uncharacterized RDD family membrane protein YckC